MGLRSLLQRWRAKPDDEPEGEESDADEGIAEIDLDDLKYREMSQRAWIRTILPIVQPSPNPPLVNPMQPIIEVDPYPMHPDPTVQKAFARMQRAAADRISRIMRSDMIDEEPLSASSSDDH
jgi:hypothetical protein